MQELAQLRSFLAVYRAGSVTGAARMLHLSQPAVSAHIQALETRTRRPLFIRVARRGVTPTTHADALARAIASHLDALEAANDLLAPSPATLIHIGAPADLLALVIIPALLPAIRQGLQIRAHGADVATLLARLRDGQLNAGICPGPVDASGLRQLALFEEEFVLVAAPAYAQQLPPELIASAGPEALAAVPLVAYGEDLPIIRVYFRALFDREPDTPADLVINDLRAVTQAVRHGAGVTVLPRYHVADLLARGELIDLHHPRHPPHEPIVLLSPDRPPSPALATITSALRRARP